VTFPINVGIPSANNDPADDQPLIRQSFSNINGYVQVDHTNPGLALGAGYHKQSTYTALLNKPYASAFGSNGAAYSKLVSGVSQLFFENNNLLETQITFANSINNPGYASIPGGLIIQWGSATASDLAIVTFPIVFPANLLSLVVAHSSTGSEATNAIVSAINKTTSQFTFRVNAASSASYSYIAVGN
jgi:hypothetical protein